MWIFPLIGFVAAIVDVLFFDKVKEKPDLSRVSFFVLKWIFWTLLSPLVLQMSLIGIFVVPAYLLYRFLRK
jgi:hypothetical protein